MDTKSCSLKEPTTPTRRKFFCEKCDYNTAKKSSWIKHKNTKKHMKIDGYKKVARVSKKVANVLYFKITSENKFECLACGKNYKFKSGLYKHRANCSHLENIITEKLDSSKEPGKITEINFKEENNDSEILNLKNELSDLKGLLKDVILTQKTTAELTQSMVNQTNKVVNQTIYNNCNNQNMTINVFLNEQCKDALNLSDWVNGIKVSLEDLQYSRANGFVNGVTNIIQKQLQDLKPTERPIHCSDKKRLQFYIKDNNEWVKDKDNKKIDSTITNIKLKQSKSITEWENLHPTYKEDPNLRDEWCAILAGITEGDTGNALKEKLALKRRIANYMELKQAMSSEKD